MQFTARVFGPALPAGGCALPLRLGGGRLTLSLSDGRRHDVALSQLALRRGGYDDRTWYLEWQDPAGPWSVAIDERSVQRQLQAQPPAGLEPALAALRTSGRRGRVRRGLGWTAIAGWGLAPLLVIALLVWKADAVGGWAAERVPVEREQQLGALIFAQQKLQSVFVDGTAANRAVETIGERLTAGSRYRYRWFVARDPSLNAYAIPGGIVVVHSGLIAAADSADELAGVLAHEVQHVELRHSLQAMAQQLGITAAVSLALGDFGSAATLASKLSQLKFSRDQERAADREGLRALVRAGIDPHGMARIFGKLERQVGPAPPPFLSTHPDTAERIAAIESTLGSTPAPAPAPLPIDWTAVRGSLP